MSIYKCSSVSLVDLLMTTNAAKIEVIVKVICAAINRNKHYYKVDNLCNLYLKLESNGKTINNCLSIKFEAKLLKI